MPSRIHYVTAISLVLASTLAMPQSLKEKAGFGGNLSALEATAIFDAEIKYCEKNSPNFKAQAAANMVRFRDDPRYKELSRDPAFVRLAPEAMALVVERNKNNPAETTCRATLEQLK